VWYKQVIKLQKPFLAISRPFISREDSDEDTACSKPMAGGEVHVSFAASSQMLSVQLNMPNCQFTNTYE